MTLIDRRATKYPTQGGFRVVVYLGVYPTNEAAQLVVDDLNLLHESGVREGWGQVLARLRGHGYARLADEIAKELGV